MQAPSAHKILITRANPPHNTVLAPPTKAGRPVWAQDQGIDQDKKNRRYHMGAGSVQVGGWLQVIGLDLDYRLN